MFWGLKLQISICKYLDQKTIPFNVFLPVPEAQGFLKIMFWGLKLQISIFKYLDQKTIPFNVFLPIPEAQGFLKIMFWGLKLQISIFKYLDQKKTICCPLSRKSKDFAQHAELCNALMTHYNIQWQNRQQYWQARTRSMVERDLLCGIIDSYDKSKLLLPTWPLKRCPKKTVYELHQRLWD